MGTTAATLAQIDAASYSDTLAGLPSGFTPLSSSVLTNGVFHNQNAAAIAVTGVVAGQQSVVLAFRGSDDRQDYLDDLNNINVDYPKFAALVASVDSYAAMNHLPVVVTGHSLGGAMAQLFMADHPAAGATTIYSAVTFGSPGGLQLAATDYRTTNYYVADDVIPFAGLFRAEIGKEARTDFGYAAALTVGLSAFSDGNLSADDVVSAIPHLTADYVNRGSVIILPAADGSRTIPTAMRISQMGIGAPECQGCRSGTPVPPPRRQTTSIFRPDDHSTGVRSRHVEMTGFARFQIRDRSALPIGELAYRVSPRMRTAHMLTKEPLVNTRTIAILALAIAVILVIVLFVV